MGLLNETKSWEKILMKPTISTGEAKQIKLTMGIMSSPSFSKILLENHFNSIQSANVHSLIHAYHNKSTSSWGEVMKVSLTKSVRTELL